MNTIRAFCSKIGTLFSKNQQPLVNHFQYVAGANLSQTHILGLVHLVSNYNLAAKLFNKGRMCLMHTPSISTRLRNT